ncbi:phage head-tail joining protein [Hansschlegelia plantiphila]|uniref:Uncharacterized protein n=1 Tax=Hansschlegelia plantiphila TaxID=374655 RepID=A0A9W6MUT8_9HYPH|nr:hypothetical protein [Hansschlegelia plantiphila]GLK67045.1 hypothetical protein GCM10008179_06830 [Hansschlegelia plantiphila]
MPATAEQLRQWRDGLMQARLQGVREYRDSNGEAVTYKSDSEMARAIAAADAEIAALAGPRPNAFTFQTSKGLDR